MATSKVTPEDLRASIARSGIPAYIIGARARINPIRLSLITRGHVHLTDALASRILLAVEQEVAANSRGANGISTRNDDQELMLRTED